MKIKTLILVSLLGSCCICSVGQSQETLGSTRAGFGSSQDWWDQRFHPETYKARQQARLDEWYKKWEISLCTADNLKEFWLLTLLVPEPSSLSSDYKAIAARNEDIKYTIQSGLVDFEAADLADQINVEYLKKNGRTTEANAVEIRRQERVRAHEEMIRQQQFEARIAAREAVLQDQIDLLEKKVQNAQAAASQAQNENYRLQRQQQQNEMQQRSRDFMNQ